MNKITKYFTFVFLSLIIMGFTSIDNIEIPSKKIDKSIKKTFKVIDFDLFPVVEFEQSNPTTRIFKIVNNGGKALGYAYVSRVNSCRSDGCNSNINSEGSEFEYFDYFIITDFNGKIELVSVYNYKATHGHQIMSRGWLKQFRGFSGENELNYGSDIQAISGATISAKAITNDIFLAESEIKRIVSLNN